MPHTLRAASAATHESVPDSVPIETLTPFNPSFPPFKVWVSSRFYITQVTEFRVNKKFDLISGRNLLSK